MVGKMWMRNDQQVSNVEGPEVSTGRAVMSLHIPLPSHMEKSPAKLIGGKISIS